ncbi:MAG: hypothetical protein AB1592_15775 [Pseudomonadota bacterium]
MLTTASSAVDGAPRLLMWTVTQIAERDGVSKQAISKRVREMAESQSLTVERNGQGHITAVNVAEYDHLRGRYADPSKAQAPSRPTPPTGPVNQNDSYDEALRQKTWHEAERRRLELAELKGELVRKDMVDAALSQVGERIVQVIDRLPRIADDIAAAVAKDGTHGARVILKAQASRLRDEIAKELATLAADAPEQDADGAEPELSL